MMTLRQGAVFPLLILLSSWQGQLTFAQGSTTGSDENVCKDEPKLKINEQKQTYCRAAEDAGDSAELNTLLLIPWGAALAICTTECFTQVVTGGGVCTAGSLIVTGIDMAATLAFAKTTEEKMQGLIEAGGFGIAAGFGGGMMGLEGANTAQGQWAVGDTYTNGDVITEIQPDGSVTLDGSSSGNAQSIPSENVDAAPTQDSGDSQACFSAAVIALRMAMKGMQISQSKDLKKDMLARAKELHFGNNIASNPTIQPAGGTNDQASGGRTGIAPAPAPVVADAPKDPAQQTCDNAKTTGDTDTVLSCAFQKDGSLPRFAGDPKAKDLFKKLTGTDIGTFAKNAAANGLDGAQFAAAMLSPGNATNAAAFAADLNNQAKQIMLAQGEAGATYAGGGGASDSGSKKGTDMGALMQGVLGQLMGGDKGKERSPAAVNEIAFRLNRDPEQVAQDRSVSIFLRVSLRYLQNQPNVAQLPWASPYNRATAGP